MALACRNPATAAWRYSNGDRKGCFWGEKVDAVEANKVHSFVVEEAREHHESLLSVRTASAPASRTAGAFLQTARTAASTRGYATNDLNLSKIHHELPQTL